MHDEITALMSPVLSSGYLGNGVDDSDSDGDCDADCKEDDDNDDDDNCSDGFRD